MLLAFLWRGCGRAPFGAARFQMIILLLPIGIGMAAVTGPPLLVIEGVRRLKPTKVLYKVVP